MKSAKKILITPDRTSFNFLGCGFDFLILSFELDHKSISM
jgi:hypothetical protein